MLLLFSTMLLQLFLMLPLFSTILLLSLLLTLPPEYCPMLPLFSTILPLSLLLTLPQLWLPMLPLFSIMPPLFSTMLHLSLLPMLPRPLMRLGSPTPTSMESLMTTLTPTSMLLRLLMLLEMCRDPTLLLSLTAVSRLSSTPLTTTMDMLLMYPMREHLSTPLLLSQLLPQLTKDKSLVCFVNIYELIYKYTKDSKK